MWFADFPWADAVAVAFTFVVGGMVGSFLNVVVHRVPLGESVVFGPSRCPHCRSPVRPTDNVPIVSWLLLRGRCRDCGGPISPRYAAVEAAAAVVAAAVVAADLATGTDIDGVLEGSDWRTGALLVLHVWLVMTLLAWGLLAAAGHPIGVRAFLIAIVIAAGGVMVGSLPDRSPGHALLDWEAVLRAMSPSPAVARLCGSGLAWAAGRRLGSSGTAPALALAAAVCGWKAVPILTVVVLLIQWPCRPRLPAGKPTDGPLPDLVMALSVPLAVVVTIAAGWAPG